PEEQVEEAIRAGLGRQRVSRFLDVGTGTGRLLVLLQDLYAKAVGIDPSPAMLKMARASLAEHRIDHAQVRQGDGLALSMPKDSQDLVALHQVMHFFDDPRPLLAEVRRVLAPSGRLLIVDFAPHALERLRTDHQHRRLGFDVSEVTRWLEALDLELVSAERLDPARAQAKTGAADTRLPVHVWIARDRRVLADLPPISSQFEVA
ncbi:MAG: class I SAM-dependent methyltransferase, partial [Devosiaceae bacterium]|nr:class I SAM-dependent methyltransferase [Devosiaceae bacterium MH13]